MRPFEIKHCLGENTVSRLLKNREKYSITSSSAVTKLVYATCRPFYPVELVLKHLADGILDRHIPVDQALLKALVHEFWVVGFKGHWGCKYRKMKGKSGSVDKSKLVGEIEEINAVICQYALEDLHNADETGLLLQTMSQWTLDIGIQD
ncbi:hypothetical protein BGZ58_004392 [Dissophora ornata]|nr:hypothetical protein BGZ58_004392 [Dissophora ornata]